MLTTRQTSPNREPQWTNEASRSDDEDDHYEVAEAIVIDGQDTVRRAEILATHQPSANRIENSEEFEAHDVAVKRDTTVMTTEFQEQDQRSKVETEDGTVCEGLLTPKEMELQRKIVKVAAEYSKVKNKNALLKHAVIELQQKLKTLDSDLQEKEKVVRGQVNEIDSLNFNNQRLTKRCTRLMEHIRAVEKRKGQGEVNGGGSNGATVGWIESLTGKSALNEINGKVLDELVVVRQELCVKIEENERLHMDMFELRADHQSEVDQMRVNNQELSGKLDRKDTELVLLNQTVEDLTRQAQERESTADREYKELCLKLETVKRDMIEKLRGMNQINRALRKEIRGLQRKLREKLPMMYDDTRFSSWRHLNLQPHSQIRAQDKVEFFQKLVEISQNARQHAVGLIQQLIHKASALLDQNENNDIEDSCNSQNSDKRDGSHVGDFTRDRREYVCSMRGAEKEIEQTLDSFTSMLNNRLLHIITLPSPPSSIPLPASLPGSSSAQIINPTVTTVMSSAASMSFADLSAAVCVAMAHVCSIHSAHLVTRSQHVNSGLHSALWGSFESTREILLSVATMLEQETKKFGDGEALEDDEYEDEETAQARRSQPSSNLSSPVKAWPSITPVSLTTLFSSLHGALLELHLHFTATLSYDLESISLTASNDQAASGHITALAQLISVLSQLVEDFSQKTRQHRANSGRLREGEESEETKSEQGQSLLTRRTRAPSKFPPETSEWLRTTARFSLSAVNTLFSSISELSKLQPTTVSHLPPLSPPASRLSTSRLSVAPIFSPVSSEAAPALPAPVTLEVTPLTLPKGIPYLTALAHAQQISTQAAQIEQITTENQGLRAQLRVAEEGWAVAQENVRVVSERLDHEIRTRLDLAATIAEMTGSSQYGSADFTYQNRRNIHDSDSNGSRFRMEQSGSHEGGVHEKGNDSLGPAQTSDAEQQAATSAKTFYTVSLPSTTSAGVWARVLESARQSEYERRYEQIRLQLQGVQEENLQLRSDLEVSNEIIRNREEQLRELKAVNKLQREEKLKLVENGETVRVNYDAMMCALTEHVCKLTEEIARQDALLTAPKGGTIPENSRSTTGHQAGPQALRSPQRSTGGSGLFPPGAVRVNTSSPKPQLRKSRSNLLVGRTPVRDLILHE